MHIQMLQALTRTLFTFYLWLSLTSAYPTHKLATDSTSPQYHHPGLHQPRAALPETPPPPPPDVEDPYIPIVASYNLKFKKYSQWFQEKSESLWGSQESHQDIDDTTHNYVSPYLTQFEDKKDGWWTWFDFGRLWRHFLWEVVPDWFGGPDTSTKEDVFLLRAMEQPSYMSVDELPDTF